MLKTGFLHFLSLLTIFAFSLSSEGAMNCAYDREDRYSSIVKIVNTETDQNCSGSIIRGCYVLTAAHCLHKKDQLGSKEDFIISSGPDSKNDLGSINNIFVHPLASEPSETQPGYLKYKYDIAVLELSTCTDNWLDLITDNISIGDETVIGGYGKTSLYGQPQRKRHVGKSNVVNVEGYHFYVQKFGLWGWKRAIISEDGRSFVSGSQCLPMSQDSGSPALIRNKVAGVYIQRHEKWLKDGNTRILKSVYINVLDPEVKKFLQDIF